MTWLRRLLQRDHLEQQLDRELRFHFDRLVDDNLRAGMTPAEARRRARLEFGGVEQLKEDCRDARATRWAHDLAQDVRFAVRVLRKDPMFTGVAVMALALGIGVNSLFFTVVNALCLRGPLADPSGLVHLSTRDAGRRPAGISTADFVDLRESVRALTQVAAYASAPAAISDDRIAPDRVTAVYVSAPSFDIVGETPLIGRNFSSDDDRVGAPPVAILATSVWKRRYSADGGIVGRTVRVNGVPTVVIGVMRGGFRFPNDADVWLPLASMPNLRNQPRNIRTLGVFGRLADGATLASAETELRAIGASLEQSYPLTNKGVTFTVEPINDRFTSRITDPAWLAFITAGVLVLLIACANVANLLLARAIQRSGEIAMRASLGASRWRIVRQLLVECSVLAAAGAIAGILLSFAGARLMSAAIPPDALPSWMALTMDGRVVAALIGICVATIFLFGFVPAFHTSRASLTHVLHMRARGVSAVSGARRWTTGFLTVQFAMTFVLLASVVQQFKSGRDTDTVVTLRDTGNVMTAWVTLPAVRYPDVAERQQFHERLLHEASTIPGVAAASVASALPAGGAPPHTVLIEGRAQLAADPPQAGAISVDPRYFETCGVSLIQGRGFTAIDGTTGQATVIVNERFARQFFRDEPPIGRRIRLVPSGMAADTLPWLSIVGIAPNLPQSRGGGAAPLAYQPLRAVAPATAALILRGADAQTTVAALRERLRRLDVDLPLYRTLSLERVGAEANWNPRISSAIVNSISSIALVLAIVGLYGVTAHSVAARVREIGIRVALGARPHHVRRLVLKRALFQLAVGVFGGVVGTIAWNRIFNVSTAVSTDSMTHPAVLAAVAGLIAGIGMLACLVPARRAVRVDPLATIRAE